MFRGDIRPTIDSGDIVGIDIVPVYRCLTIRTPVLFITGTYLILNAFIYSLYLVVYWWHCWAAIDTHYFVIWTYLLFWYTLLVWRDTAVSYLLIFHWYTDIDCYCGCSIISDCYWTVLVCFIIIIIDYWLFFITGKLLFYWYYLPYWLAVSIKHYWLCIIKLFIIYLFI